MDLDYELNLSNSESIHLKVRKPTISETYKYYIKLLGKSIQGFENLNQLIYSDTSLPLFEENIYLVLIDAFNLEKEVVKILLSQNDYQIKKVLGFKWFFRNLSSEFCIKELFPFISVSVRCKVINRLSKHLDNVEEAQKYFEYIKKTYDNERAHFLLPKCSSEFILNYFEKNNNIFEDSTSTRVLLNICKRYPGLGVRILSTIIDNKKDNFYSAQYKKILLYLSGNHPDLVVPFFKKYHSYLTFFSCGIRLTKRLGSKLKKDLFPDLVKSSIFRDKVLFLILNHEEQIKYFAGVLNKYDSFFLWSSSDSDLLKLIPKAKRLEMIQAIFSETYNVNFNESSNFWSAGILELLPTAVREPFVEKLEVIFKKADKAELNENVDNTSFSPECPEQFIYLYNSSVAFEKFKEVLKKCATVARREKVLPYMVKNCRINDDLKMLQQLVEYVATRYRNDDYNVITSFTRAITKHFPSSKLNLIILEKLEELAYFISLKRSSDDYVYWKELLIYHRLENEMEVDVNNFFQSVVLKSNHGQSFVRNFNSKQSKTFILAVCNEITRWIQDKSSEAVTEPLQKVSETLLKSLICTCRDFNDNNKRNRIFFRDIQGLEEIIKREAKEKFADLGGEEWPVDVWELMFASRQCGNAFDSIHKSKYLSYIVRKHPKLIVNYLDTILSYLLSCNLRRDQRFLTDFILSASFLGLTEKVKKFILNEFENGSTIGKRKSALEFYSHICTIVEFSSAVEKYIPKQERVEQNNEDFDKIQILVPTLLRNVKPRWKNLDLTLKFYVGDFLKLVLPSFSACCYCTRYDLIIPFLKEQLAKTPPKISYKTNLIKLIVELSDRKERSEFYLKCWDEYTHYSVRSVLMVFISKSFLEEGTRESFKVFEKCILESDEIIFDSKPDLRKIPKEFFSDYIHAVWRFSEGREKAFRDNFRREMLWWFNENYIKLLKSEFCESVIAENLFDSYSDNGIETFTTLYLASEAESVQKRVFFLLDLIKTRKPKSQAVCGFINTLIARSKDKPADFAEVFRILQENWPEYPLGVLFEEYILITYYNFYYNLVKKMSDTDQVMVELGKELKTFFLKIEDLNDLVFIYAKVLKTFFMFLESSKAIVAVKELVTDLRNRSVAILAILSLPDDTVYWCRIEKTFNKKIIQGKKVLNEIFDAIEGCNDRIVEIYMRSKFDVVKS